MTSPSREQQQQCAWKGCKRKATAHQKEPFISFTSDRDRNIERSRDKALKIITMRPIYVPFM